MTSKRLLPSIQAAERRKGNPTAQRGRTKRHRRHDQHDDYLHDDLLMISTR
jgi:hypothetical protein